LTITIGVAAEGFVHPGGTTAWAAARFWLPAAGRLVLVAVIWAHACATYGQVAAPARPGVAPKASAAAAPAPAPAVERRVVQTEADAGPNFTLGRLNGKTLTVELARVVAGFAAQRFSVVAASRNGVESYVPANLSVSQQGTLTWQDIGPGAFGQWRFTVKAEDAGGRTREVPVPVEVRLPADTPGVCEPASAWCVYLRERWAKGEAAGNLEDFYNNRDGGHATFPAQSQSKQIRMLPGGHAALLSPWPTRNVVGNASVVYQGPNGANMERFFSFTNSEFDAKVRVYEANHIFWYPAHTDIFGSGDLFHFNAAYTNTTTGSSGSEMDEVSRTFLVWGALRPDVKMWLVEKGLLAPVTQMLLRRNRVASDAEYLTGAAHVSGMSDIPADIAEARHLELVQAANAITVKSMPPLAKLRVVREDFSASDREQLATNAWGVHRVWRREEGTREIVLSAEDSLDLNGRPLTYRWAVLRGGKWVKIEPVDADARSVRIVLSYPQRYQFEPVQPGGQTNWTTRLDVALFASNGTWYSPPAMFTVYALDSETRFYDLTGRMLWKKPTGRPDHPRLK
jgi:hypothetical protein